MNIDVIKNLDKKVSDFDVLLKIDVDKIERIDGYVRDKIEKTLESETYNQRAILELAQIISSQNEIIEELKNRLSKLEKGGDDDA